MTCISKIVQPSRSTMKLFMKNFGISNHANTKDSSSLTLNKSNLNNDDEVESIMNIHIASRLNENIFYSSPNQNNFYIEQIEEKLKSRDMTEDSSLKGELDSLETSLKNYMALMEQLKKQVG
jgi:hypothetical protein